MEGPQDLEFVCVPSGWVVVGMKIDKLDPAGCSGKIATLTFSGGWWALWIMGVLNERMKRCMN